MVTFLVLMHPALLIVDHIHFQVANANNVNVFDADSDLSFGFH